MIASRITSDVLIDSLCEGRYVHLGGSLGFQWKRTVGEVVAWFANSRENAQAHERRRWRCLIVSSDYSQAVHIATLAKPLIANPNFKSWNSGGDGKYGHYRAVSAAPLSVMAVNASNMLWVITHTENKEVWHHIWDSVQPDTKILAINSELYGQWNEFLHL